MTVATTDRLETLIATYQRHRTNYRADGISEFQLRMQFVDPLFIAMGWDVRNERGYAEAYKDVVHEDAVTVGTATKAPDYALLDLQIQLDAARTDQDTKHLQRLIDHTDREIDNLVYELYDLTDEEIAIVEGEVG